MKISKEFISRNWEWIWGILFAMIMATTFISDFKLGALLAIPPVAIMIGLWWWLVSDKDGPTK